MPALTRWFLRAGTLYFLAAVLTGLLLAAPIGWAQPVLAVFGPTQLHLFTVGWITQITFGVAYSMFPRHTAKQPRGSEPLWPRIRRSREAASSAT